MKAAVLEKLNSPWVIKDLPDPIPGPDQVLIKVHACGMCGTDVHVHNGLFGAKPPLVCGHEPVGEIVKLGPGVVDLKVGDRVGVSWIQKGCGRCEWCQKKNFKYCPNAQTWVQMGGGNSELMLAWAEGCTLLPENLSYVQAAPLFCAGFTIASGFYNANPKPGEKVAILGFGGLGHLALQYAKAKGHEVVVITTSKDKVSLAKELGADEVIIAKEGVGKALADRGGVDIILHTANSSKAANDALDGLLPEGRLVVIAIDPNPIQALPMKLLNKQLKIQGSLMNKREDLVDILNLAAQGKIKTIVETYPLEKINDALQRLETGKVHMRAVIEVLH